MNRLSLNTPIVVNNCKNSVKKITLSIEKGICYLFSDKSIEVKTFHIKKGKVVHSEKVYPKSSSLYYNNYLCDYSNFMGKRNYSW